MNENNNEMAVEAVDSQIINEDNILKLMKPIEVNGRMVDTLIFDFSKIKGRVLLQCLKQAQKEDANILVPSLSMVYQAVVAAKALGMKYDDVLELSGTDFTAVTARTSRFLSGADKSEI